MYLLLDPTGLKTCRSFRRANIYSFVLMGSQHRKGVAYGVTLGPTNRNTVTKASRWGVAT
jgi:hypothetical protein